MTPDQIFLNAVPGDLYDSLPCWLWQRALDPGGYAAAKVGKQLVKVHRWMWEFFNGPIPPGLVLDHLCRNRRCINPWHLEPVTDKINALRGESPRVVLSRTNTCVRGHSLDDAYVVANGPQRGRRNCRQCTRAAQKVRRSGAVTA